MFETEFEFTLPKGYLDKDGILHRQGIMRLATAMDEIVPLRDPRVKSNPAYATVLILARVINRLGTLEDLLPSAIEQFYACDLNYLQMFYRRINELEIEAPEDSTPHAFEHDSSMDSDSSQPEGEASHREAVSASF